MRVTVDERTIRLTEGTATFGGGPVTMEGTARLAGLSVEDVSVAVKATEVGLRYPVLSSTAIYALAMVATGNPMLVFAALAVGLLCGLERPIGWGWS